MYKQGEGEKLLGVFLLHRPAIMVRDPDLIKTIMTKDFVHFNDHGLFFDEQVDPISAHLFSLGGKLKYFFFKKRKKINYTLTFRATVERHASKTFPVVYFWKDENVFSHDNGHC